MCTISRSPFPVYPLRGTRVEGISIPNAIFARYLLPAARWGSSWCRRDSHMPGGQGGQNQSMVIFPTRDANNIDTLARELRDDDDA